ncbi:MAG: PEP-CTERM sorting domain-containing protein [Verrucomicrobiota bacterium]
MIRIFVVAAAIYLFNSNQLAAAVVFNFENSVFTDTINPLDGSGEMRWAGIGTNGGTDIDMIAVVSAGSTYDPGNGPQNRNGPVPPLTGEDVPAGLTRIKVRRATDVNFTFSFVDQATGDPVVLPCVALSMWDFDQSASGVVTESVQFLGTTGGGGSYTYATSTNIGVDSTIPTEPVFSSTVSGDESDNPTDVSNPTAAQQEKVVLFNIVNASGFEVNLAVGGNGGTQSRTFFLGAGVPFTIPTTTASIPEPSTSMALLLGAFFILRRSRSAEKQDC